MARYRHLFFDLDNTLYDFDANAKLAMEKAFDQLGLLQKIPSFDAYFKEYIPINDSLWALYREKKIAKDVLRGKRHKDTLAIFNIIPEIMPTEIDDLYLKIMSEQTELFPDTIEVLTALKNRGYMIHIITNGFVEVQHEKMKNTGLDKFITNTYISEELKAPKPSKVIFEHAIKSSNARKKESIMIGDSWESDIIGAKNFGIDQVFFKLKNTTVDFNGYGAPTHTIYELKELLDIL